MPNESEDESTLEPKPFDERAHRGRAARVAIALVLTGLGGLWAVPYAGYAYSLILFAPAVVLLIFATRGARNRPLLLIFSVPTALGIVASLLSWIHVIRFYSGDYLFGVLAWTLGTTGVAVLLGYPRAAR